ncbi:RT0821/Lpp0805 family surface protein [Methylobacterium oxalidis]|uniref:RT0821/Lpp0805 family surface protein n=1 Tax=Methylobacterium oxalidis TaxID=944322 RepID=UPI00331494B4
MRRRDCKASSSATPGRPACSPGPLAASASALGLVLILCGCGQPLITFQSEPKAEAAAAEAPEPTVTGSISKRPPSFGADLGEEDWRRARAALGVALDPQGNGRPVKWDNPETSLRGSVNPTGLPYVANDEICRDFLATVITPEKSRFVRGTGCKLSGGAWELKRLRPSRAG